MSIQKLFLAFSQAHTRIGCKKDASCKIGQFLDGLDKFSFDDEKTFDEIRVLFTNHCIKHHTTFLIMNEFISPKNSDKLN